jgi:hypothetical protein
MLCIHLCLRRRAASLKGVHVLFDRRCEAEESIAASLLVKSVPAKISWQMRGHANGLRSFRPRRAQFCGACVNSSHSLSPSLLKDASGLRCASGRIRTVFARRSSSSGRHFDLGGGSRPVLLRAQIAPLSAHLPAIERLCWLFHGESVWLQRNDARQ